MEVLKKEMKQKRLSRKKLAKKIGVSSTTIKNWINGTCAPNFDNMDALEKLGFSETACLEPSKEVEV